MDSAKLTWHEWSHVIRMLRPILITLMCFAHLPNVQGYVSDFDQFNQPLTLLPVLIKDMLARGAVPLLTVVSGYLAYHSFVKRRYMTWVSLKVKRLLVPLILWNLIAVVAYWCYYRLFHFNFMSVKSIDDPITLLQAVLGISRLPINAPTYFIRDLFILLLALPLIHAVCRRGWLLLLALGAYGAFLLGHSAVTLTWGNGFTMTLLNRADMLLFFTLGYVGAWRDIRLLKVSGFEAGMLLCITCAALWLGTMVVSALTPAALVYAQFKTLMGGLWLLLLPAVASLLWQWRETRFGAMLVWLSPYAFTLYLSHHISALVYAALWSRGLSEFVSERSPLWELAVYMLAYAVFLWCVAIVVLRSWRWLLRCCYVHKLWRSDQAATSTQG